MTYSNIISLLCPTTTPIEEGYLWAKFPIRAVEGCEFVYYSANDYIASELLVNQIKPTLTPDTGYFVVYPMNDSVEVEGTRTVISATFAVVHFGWYDNFQSEAIARTHTTQLLEYYRSAQQRYITGMRINNTNFSEWSDDNSAIQQYTAVVTVRAIEPYALAPNCHDRNR